MEDNENLQVEAWKRAVYHYPLYKPSDNVSPENLVKLEAAREGYMKGYIEAMESQV